MQQLDLFGGQRLARRPYCTDDLTTGLRIRSQDTALRHSYVQANSPALRWRLVFDIDRPAAVFAAQDGGVATPSWIAENPRNGHAHLGYEIETPLVTSQAGRVDPLRFAAAVEYAYMEKLGADRGYAGLICKNPLHEQWRTSVQRVQAYDLAELAEWVDLPSRIPKKQLAESPLGRNVAIFDRLRHWAYRNVKHYEDSAEWKFACLIQSVAFNSSFKVALPDNEVQHIARSVAKWTWTKFDADASDARFSALQAHRGRLGGTESGKSRAAKAEEKSIEAQALAARGVSQKAIAAQLGVSDRTIRNLLRRKAETKP